MAQYNRIRVLFQGDHRIHQAFAFGDRRVFDTLSDRDYVPTEAFHRGDEGSAGPGAGFVKHAGQGVAVQQITCAYFIHHFAHFLGTGEDVRKGFAVELVHR